MKKLLNQLINYKNTIPLKSIHFIKFLKYNFLPISIFFVLLLITINIVTIISLSAKFDHCYNMMVQQAETITIISKRLEVLQNIVDSRVSASAYTESAHSREWWDLDPAFIGTICLLFSVFFCVIIKKYPLGGSIDFSKFNSGSSIGGDSISNGIASIGSGSSVSNLVSNNIEEISTGSALLLQEPLSFASVLSSGILAKVGNSFLVGAVVHQSITSYVELERRPFFTEGANQAEDLKDLVGEICELLNVDGSLYAYAISLDRTIIRIYNESQSVFVTSDSPDINQLTFLYQGVKDATELLGYLG